MMTQDTTARERRTAHTAGTYEARQADRHADALSDLILGDKLSHDGMVAAHGARGLLYAILALRETIAAASADTAGTVAGLDATLGVIAGAVTDSVAGDDAPMLAEASR